MFVLFFTSYFSDDRPENNRDSLERNIDAPLIQDGDTPTISPSNTLSYKDQIMPGIVPGVISGEELELMEAARDMVQNVLYSTRDNINFVHEILRQVSGGNIRWYILKLCTLSVMRFLLFKEGFLLCFFISAQNVGNWLSFPPF